MILAIIERIEDITEKKPFNKRYYLTENYKSIFDELNILLFPVVSEINLDKVCELCDGLIVTGSCMDINPIYYNEKAIEGKNYDVDEFKLDKKLIELFSSKNKPILGICGGLQSINVAFGGTLNQNISNHNINNSKHKIKISNDTFLNKIYENNNLLVNSYHNQSIKDLSPIFKISAISEDGGIEGIEKDNIIGVQWHPEEMKDIKFFKKFVTMFFDK